MRQHLLRGALNTIWTYWVALCRYHLASGMKTWVYLSWSQNCDNACTMPRPRRLLINAWWSWRERVEALKERAGIGKRRHLIREKEKRWRRERKAKKRVLERGQKIITLLASVLCYWREMLWYWIPSQQWEFKASSLSLFNSRVNAATIL